jgi:hypothetical protein
VCDEPFLMHGLAERGIYFSPMQPNRVCRASSQSYRMSVGLSGANLRLPGMNEAYKSKETPR